MADTMTPQFPKIDPDNMSFEAALLEMEGIVKLLESGQCSLEKALESYERGQILKQFCLDKLSAARASIERIAPENPEIGDDQPPPNVTLDKNIKKLQHKTINS